MSASIDPQNSDKTIGSRIKDSLLFVPDNVLPSHRRTYFVMLAGCAIALLLHGLFLVVLTVCSRCGDEENGQQANPRGLREQYHLKLPL